MWKVLVAASVLLGALPKVVALPYNRPDCPSWPSEEEWGGLRSALSKEAALYGPLSNSIFAEQCETIEFDAFEVSKAGNGTCMHKFACANQFCIPRESWPEVPFDLPPYVVDARSEDDIVAALDFGSRHNLEVSVKSTGHSYTGSSTAANSLLIWLQNFPRDDEITEGYVDSCGTEHFAVIGVNGGEIWDDVLEAVGADYHVVTGGGRTVGAVGGWLQGGGLSFTSREHGLGIDQAVDFRVVLANGTIVHTDACTHPDLFWALRGGGGGTFGVVTHASYKLHPPSKLVVLSWTLQGIDYLLEQQDFETLLGYIGFFMSKWIEWAPKLDTRWSGFWNAGGFAQLIFLGSREDADSTLINELQRIYDEELDKSPFVGTPEDWAENNGWGVLPPQDSVTEFDSWYDYRGGAAAYRNPLATDATAQMYNIINEQNSRLMPISFLEERPEEVWEFIMNLISTGALGPVNYYLGGKINDVPEDATSIHPAMRRAVFNVFTFSVATSQVVRDFLPNNVTGVCNNHHSPWEPDWRNALWGSNYPRLEALKKEYDPDHRFNPWHSVGYVGLDVDDETFEVQGTVDDTCPPPAECQDSPRGTFGLAQRVAGEKAGCAHVASTSARLQAWYCENSPRVLRSCRATCDNCRGDRFVKDPDKCRDNATRVFAKYDDLKERNCRSLQRKRNATKRRICAKHAEARRVCPETCGTC